MSNFKNQFTKYDNSLKKEAMQYHALLGKTEKVVEHPTRKGFCYARMADNLSELIVVFNDKVSQVWNMPVLIERRGITWYVVGRDIQRYSDWGTSAPFLPKHHAQHEFNRDEGTGADAVFIYPDQFMPLLVYPSGSAGSANLIVAPYTLQRDNDFIYVGNTGTQNLLVYKPTDGNGIMGLLYLDKTTGNPGVLIASGTPFINSLTGTASLLQYAPYPETSNQEPLYFFRLVSGTSSLTWSNLYNARQFIGGSSGGTGSTGGGGTSVHNDLTGLQGGITGSYYHLTHDQWVNVISGTYSTGTSSVSTGTAGDYAFEVAGVLATGTNIPNAILFTRSTTISKCYMYCKDTGVTGTTIVDVNLNGTTIFTTQANRPNLTAGGFSWNSFVPDVLTFVEGDVLTLDIDQIAVDAEDMVLVMAVAGTSGGGGGGTPIEISDSLPVPATVTTVNDINTLTIDGGKVVEDGAGIARIVSVVASINTVQTRATGTYSALNTGDGTEIDPLTIIFTPRHAGNKVILEWVVNGEGDENIGFLVSRNGTLLPNSTDADNNRWAVVATWPFDNDDSSTPSNLVVKIVDEDSLDVESTYRLLIRSTESTEYTFYLNRCIFAEGEDVFENLLSVGTATEIGVF